MTVESSDVEATAINGLDWEKSVQYMVDYRDKFRNKYVFIIIGPIV